MLTLLSTIFIAVAVKIAVELFTELRSWTLKSRAKQRLEFIDQRLVHATSLDAHLVRLLKEHEEMHVLWLAVGIRETNGPLRRAIINFLERSAEAPRQGIASPVNQVKSARTYLAVGTNGALKVNFKKAIGQFGFVLAFPFFLAITRSFRSMDDLLNSMVSTWGMTVTVALTLYEVYLLILVATIIGFPVLALANFIAALELHRTIHLLPSVAVEESLAENLNQSAGPSTNLTEAPCDLA